MDGDYRIDRHYRRTARLRGGTRVQVRLIGPDDRERFVAGFERLSDESRYRRFFVPVSRLKDEVVDRLLDTDDFHHLALGAECLASNGSVIGPLVAVARYIRLQDDPAAAEAAVTVGDDLQQRGLGRLMLQILIEAAAERGIRRFRAHMLPDNTAVRSLLSALDVPLTQSTGDQMLVYEIQLPESAPKPASDEPLYAILRASARQVRRTADLAMHLPWVRRRLRELSGSGEELVQIAKGHGLDISQPPVDPGGTDPGADGGPDT